MNVSSYIVKKKIGIIAQEEKSTLILISADVLQIKRGIQRETYLIRCCQAVYFGKNI